MKKFVVFAMSLMFAVSILGLAACAQEKTKAGDPMVGDWEMVGNPSKVVSVVKEGDNYFYVGSQGKMAATKVDENTLKVPMSGIDVTVQFDPATNELSVNFMGESYKYTKKAAGK